MTWREGRGGFRVCAVYRIVTLAVSHSNFLVICSRIDSLACAIWICHLTLEGMHVETNDVCFCEVVGVRMLQDVKGRREKGIHMIPSCMSCVRRDTSVLERACERVSSPSVPNALIQTGDSRLTF